MKNSIRNRVERGFTLLEVVVGILLFSFVIFYTFEMLVSSYRYYLQTKNRTTTTDLGQQQMEQLRKNVLASASVSNQPWTNFSSPYSNYQWEANYYDYSVDGLAGTSCVPGSGCVMIQIVLNVRGPMNSSSSLSPAGKQGTFVTLVAKALSATIIIPPPPPPTPPTPPTPSEPP